MSERQVSDLRKDAPSPSPVIIIDSDDAASDGNENADPLSLGLSGKSSPESDPPPHPQLDCLIKVPELVDCLALSDDHCQPSSLPTPRLEIRVNSNKGSLYLALDFDEPVPLDAEIDSLHPVARFVKFELYSCLVKKADDADVPDPSTGRWVKMSDLYAVSLPVICSLNNFEADVAYFFAARAVDSCRNFTNFSPMCYIVSPSEQ